MPWLPILPDKLAATEARLGVAFPLGYRAIVGDSTMRALLAEPTVMYDRQTFVAQVKPDAREDVVSRLLEVPHPRAALRVH